MALLDLTGPRLRRAPRRRTRFVLLAVALYAAASLLATWPALKHPTTSFFSSGAAGYGEPAPGDHLQTGWNLWLFGEQLENGHAPWLDPYSFQPEVTPRVDFQGLVFGLPYWPLFAAFGAVVAWNVFALLAIACAGLFTCGWLRSLDVPRVAALAGGLAFALAPYRVAQSTGHLLGAAAIFLPLSLWGLEIRRMLIAGIGILAIPLSGQVHLALGTVPLVLLYAFARRRVFWAVPGAIAACVAGLAVQHFAIAGSIHASGRSLAEVDKYSAHFIGLVSRQGGGETFIFLGWLTPLLALAGLALLLLERRYSLAAVLAAAVVVPIVFALGTNLPTYSLARHIVPELKVSRVPERLLPITCLALAALLAFAIALLRPWLAALVLALVVVDLRYGIEPFHATAVGGGKAAYEALNDAPPGRLLDLPVFLPDVHLNSTYLYDDMLARRQRPTGYSTTVPYAADRIARMLRPATCGTVPFPLLRQLGIRYVALHRGIYAQYDPKCETKAEAALRGHGFRQVGPNGIVTILAAPAA